MKYMVVECHPGYAVVLDEAGSFLKVANRQYEVGQMVTEVVPMQTPPRKRTAKWVTSLVAAAACLALVLGITLPRTQPGVDAQPYASVYVKINPEVRIDVDRNDRVVGLEGVNQDGVALIEGYAYEDKHLDLVTDELVDRAIEMGYLQPDGQITISLDSQDQTWMDDHSHTLSDHLQTHLQERLVVHIEIKLCDHEHPGRSHHEYDYEEEDGICTDPENPNRVEIQPDWEDPDEDRPHHDDDDDHDDHHDDDRDDADDDDDEDEDEDDDDDDD